MTKTVNTVLARDARNGRFVTNLSSGTRVVSVSKSIYDSALRSSGETISRFKAPSGLNSDLCKKK